MDIIELRPLSLGELLDRTIALYRGHFWLFVGIMAIPSALSIPFNAFMLAVQSPLGPAAGSPAIPPAGITMVAFAVFGVLFLLVYAIAIGAVTFAVSESYLGQSATVRGSYGKVRGRLWRIVGVSVNVWLRFFGMMMLVMLGVAAIIVGGAAAAGGQAPAAIRVALGVGLTLALIAAAAFCAFWALRYSVSIPALLLEGLGVRAAIRRSVQLTVGRKKQLFMAILLAAIMGYVGVIIFQGPFWIAMIMSGQGGQVPAWLLFSLSISGAVGGAITGSLLMIVLVLCYYDTRIRKEAFDLQFMMSSLDSTASAPSASHAG